MKGRLTKGADIDLGLSISALSLHYGETRTNYEIACFCGCRPQRIDQIYQKALRKMRFRLRAIRDDIMAEVDTE